MLHAIITARTLGSCSERIVHFSPIMRSLYVFLLWIFKIYVGCSVNNSNPCGVETTWDEAVKCCALPSRENESGLPTVRKKKSFLMLMEDMESKEYTSVWLGFQRIEYSGWQWMDSVDGPLSLPGRGNCAYYNRTDAEITSMECSTVSHGYICQLKVCETCASLGSYGKICKKLSGQCFLSFCEKKNWYNARADCLSHRGDLAVFKGYPNPLDTGAPSSTCNSFWIGLRREMWGFRGSDVIPVGMWGVGEPSNRGKCAILHQENREYEIQVTSCLNKYAYICKHADSTTIYYDYQSVTLPNNLTTTSLENEESSSKSGLPLEGIIGISITASIIGVGTFVIFLILLKRRKKNDGNLQSAVVTETSNRKSHVIGDVTIPLMQLSQNRGNENESLDNDIIFRDDTTVLPKLRRELIAKITRMHGKIETWSWSDKTVRVPLDNIYTELSTQKVITETMGQKETEVDSYNVLLRKDEDSRDGPFRIILIGDAGTGKTTLCKKMLNDWVHFVKQETQETVISGIYQFDIVLPITLRHVIDELSAVQTALHQLQYTEEEAQLLEKYVYKHLDRVLFILDGYDEFNASSSPNIAAIANGEEARANVFVTARAVDFGQYLKDRRGNYIKAVLKGFSERGVHDYIERFYENDSELCRSLKKKIKISSDLCTLSKYPAILLLMVVLWKDGKSLSATVTGFYQDFVDYICARQERKETKVELTSKKELVNKYRDLLMKVGDIAVKGLLGNKMQLLFPLEVVENALGRSGWNLGIFCKDEVLKGQQYVSFYHKTVQEYFASYFIVNCSASERNALLTSFYAQSQPLKDTTMMSKFVSGLGGTKLYMMISEIIEESPENNAEAATKFQLDFLSENRTSKLTLPPVVHLEKTFTQSSKLIERYLSMDASKLKELVLEICQVEEIGVLKYLKAVKLESLKIVYVQDITIWDDFKDHPESVAAIISKFKLHAFSLNSFLNPISRKIPSICSLLHTMKTLYSLEFSLTELSDDLFESLVGIIQHLQNLRRLYLPNTNDNQPVLQVQPLVRQLHKLLSLKVFDISGRTMAPLVSENKAERFPNLNELRIGNFLEEHRGGGIYFVEQLSNLTELKILQVGENSLGNTGIKILVSQMQYLKCVTHIDLRSCGCDDKTEWANLVSNLKLTTEIQSCIFAGNCIGNEAVVELGKVLMGLHHIQYVDLTECRFDQESSAQAMLHVIQNFEQHLHLVLSGNNMSFVENDLISAISECTYVQLNLEDSGLSTESISFIELRQDTKLE